MWYRPCVTGTSRKYALTFTPKSTQSTPSPVEKFRRSTFMKASRVSGVSDVSFLLCSRTIAASLMLFWFTIACTRGSFDAAVSFAFSAISAGSLLGSAINASWFSGWCGVGWG